MMARTDSRDHLYHHSPGSLLRDIEREKEVRKQQLHEKRKSTAALAGCFGATGGKRRQANEGGGGFSFSFGGLD
jgi:hypothetical protein